MIWAYNFSYTNNSLKPRNNHMKNMEKIDAREIRRKLGLNQQQFWSQLGVTQSGGSRYESGRNIPTPIALLVAVWASGKIDDSDLAQARRAIGRPAMVMAYEYFK